MYIYFQLSIWLVFFSLTSLTREKTSNPLWKLMAEEVIYIYIYIFAVTYFTYILFRWHSWRVTNNEQSNIDMYVRDVTYIYIYIYSYVIGLYIFLLNVSSIHFLQIQEGIGIYSRILLWSRVTHGIEHLSDL